MSQFAGKKSLSSAEYFGRDERPAWQTQRDGMPVMRMSYMFI
jgi:hypothetical protein